MARKWCGGSLPNPIADTELPVWTLADRTEVRAPRLDEVVALLQATGEDVRFATYLARSETIAVNRHGKVIGFYIALERDEDEVRRAVAQLGPAVGQVLEEISMTEEVLARVFDLRRPMPAHDHRCRRQRPRCELLRDRGRDLILHPRVQIVVAKQQWSEVKHELERRLSIMNHTRLALRVKRSLTTRHSGGDQDPPMKD